VSTLSSLRSNVAICFLCPILMRQSFLFIGAFARNHLKQLPQNNHGPQDGFPSPAAVPFPVELFFCSAIVSSSVITPSSPLHSFRDSFSTLFRTAKYCTSGMKLRLPLPQIFPFFGHPTFATSRKRFPLMASNYLSTEVISKVTLFFSFFWEFNFVPISLSLLTSGLPVFHSLWPYLFFH